MPTPTKKPPAPRRAAASPLLGGLEPGEWMARYWQKRPMLVRQAVPGFAGIVDRDQLFALATREDATSRLVIQHARRRGGSAGSSRWERHDGPFGALDTGMLPARDWTLLVHGVESLVPGGWELLGRFDFLPAARIDDLMVSYAADGGGVGPHVDDYDVFLLQGPGKRRWQISRQKDLAVDASAAIKVLARFVPEEEWLLEPGDMLYLPPGVAHHGVAEGPCFTYSIGFLAPTERELGESFSGWLGGALAGARLGETRYTDPDLRPPSDPVEIGDAMVDRVEETLAALRWDRGDVEEFLGCFLTRPRPQARFTPPVRRLDEDALGKRLGGHGRLALALPSRGLVRGGRVFLNGQAHEVGKAARALLARLFRARALPLPLETAVDARTRALLAAAHAAGHVVIS